MSSRAAAELRALNNATVETADADDLRIRSVVAGIVNIVPATGLHVNPTFGFTRSLGFQKERVAVSIADGCFQTMRSLQVQKWEAGSEVQRSLKALEIGVESQDDPKGAQKRGECPYFKCVCPFWRARAEIESQQKKDACQAVYQSCCDDPVHQQLRIQDQAHLEAVAPPARTFAVGAG